MAGLRIEDYVDVDSIDGTELMLVSKNGAYRKITIEEIRNLANDITNTALADLVGKVASAQDVKNILTSINSQLSDNTQQIRENTMQGSNVLSNSAKSFISKILDGSLEWINLTFLGDSISQGLGASNIDNSYISLVFSAIKNVTNNGNGSGYELTANFNAPPKGFVYNGTYSIGTNGPVKQSIILQPNTTITFTRAFKYIKLFFHKANSSGNIEIRQDGNLINTINCSGTEDLNGYTDFIDVNDTKPHIYTITCVNAQVELLGVMCVNDNVGIPVVYCNRFAVSGTNTGDYTNTNTLESICKVGSYDGNKTIFVIALGTNDIYNKDGKAVSSATYKANLQTIANYLLNAGYIVVLQVPLVATNEWKEVIEPFENYRKAVYDLANQLNCPILDLSSLNFNTSLYSDGLHPNDEGHYQLTQAWTNFLGIPKSISINAKTINIVKTAIYEATNFIDDSTSGVKRLDLINNKRTDTILNIYIKNKSNLLTVPYQELCDYANSKGIWSLKNFQVGAYISLYYYASGSILDKTKAPYKSLLDDSLDNLQIIIEYVE